MSNKRLPVAVRLYLTAAGTGLVPKGGGTVASLLALPLAWFLTPYPLITVPVILTLTSLGVWLTNYAQNHGWGHDDSRITVDEFCGMLVALAFLPAVSVWGRLIIYLIGFGLFRLLDIFKFPPVSWAEKLPGGWGVMADDVVAAVLTNGLLRLIMLIPIPLIYGY